MRYAAHHHYLFSVHFCDGKHIWDPEDPVYACRVTYAPESRTIILSATNGNPSDMTDFALHPTHEPLYNIVKSDDSPFQLYMYYVMANSECMFPISYDICVHQDMFLRQMESDGTVACEEALCAVVRDFRNAINTLRGGMAECTWRLHSAMRRVQKIVDDNSTIFNSSSVHIAGSYHLEVDVGVLVTSERASNSRVGLLGGVVMDHYHRECAVDLLTHCVRHVGVPRRECCLELKTLLVVTPPTRMPMWESIAAQLNVRITIVLDRRDAMRINLARLRNTDILLYSAHLFARDETLSADFWFDDDVRVSPTPSQIGTVRRLAELDKLPSRRNREEACGVPTWLPVWGGVILDNPQLARGSNNFMYGFHDLQFGLLWVYSGFTSCTAPDIDTLLQYVVGTELSPSMYEDVVNSLVITYNKPRPKTNAEAANLVHIVVPTAAEALEYVAQTGGGHSRSSSSGLLHTVKAACLMQATGCQKMVKFVTPTRLLENLPPQPPYVKQQAEKFTSGSLECCCICRDGAVNVMLHCGHALCLSCTAQITKPKKCPTCRQPFNNCYMLEDQRALVHGSKLRRLARLCGKHRGSMVLVLCEFDTMARHVGRALMSYGVPCTMFVGNDRNKYNVAKKMMMKGKDVFVGSIKHFLGFSVHPDHVIFLHPIVRAHEKIPGVWPALQACLGGAVDSWHYMCTKNTVDEDMYKHILNYDSIEVVNDDDASD